MLYRSLLVLIFTVCSGMALAQNGTITGVVKDATTAEFIIGANVYIQGTTVGSATDFDGKFSIPNVKPGTYNLVVSFITYKTHVIPDVVVESGKITTVTVDLKEDVSELTEVVVTGTREISNDISLLSAIRDSKLVVSGISSEQIIKTPDRDAAQIMQRVPGVSVVDNRFVMIRGVSERYNQVMINRVIGPSTEVDKRSFSFDLIPSGSIDQILIYKSGNPELPGDFAGGIVQVITREAQNENYFKFGTSVGVRNGTTFRDYSQSKGSNTDKFGFDNGFRALPSGFPTTDQLQNSNRTSSLRQDAGRLLENNFDYTTRSAPVDWGMNMELAKSFSIKNVQVNSLNSISYSNSYLFKTVQFDRYLFNDQEIEKRFTYSDRYYENDVRISGISNWAVLVGNSKFEFKNLLNLLGENQTIIREGFDLFQSADRKFTNYSYHYLNRFIYSGQLQGTHHLANNSVTVDWVAGFSKVSRNEPDFRRFRTFRLMSSGEETNQMQLPPSANLFETGRFYSDLKDEGVAFGLNVEKKFGNPNEKRTPAIKAGVYADRKTREFNARYVSYLYPSFFDAEEGERLIRLPLSQIFSPGNIRTQDGFVIEEGTRPSDRYTGENMLLSGYVGGSLPAGKFDISGGLRVEDNRQQLSTQTTSGAVEVDNPVFVPMPFANVAYNVSERSLFRVAYSRTVNRPEFRELAPFLYYDFELELGVQGQPNLKTAMINNVDLRWETYPNPGESISVGVFYKTFRNPIESILLLTTEAPQATFGNADEAVGYGAEVEIRKSLASLGVSRLLRNLSVNVNASYIYTEVDLGSQAGFQQQKRQLQGQSPYLINFGLYYNDEDAAFSTSLAYNVFGQRIFAVGDINFPSIYELPRNALDLQIAKRFNKFEAKLNIQNLLDTPYRFFQDTDVDNKINTDNGRDEPIMVYKVGQQFSLGLSYKVSK